MEQMRQRDSEYRQHPLQHETLLPPAEQEQYQLVDTWFQRPAGKASNYRFLTYSTHNREVEKGRNRNTCLYKNALDKGRKYEFIMTRSVMKCIHNGQNHARGKVYGQTLLQRIKKTSTRLSDGVIVRTWSKNKHLHHVRDLWIFSKVMGNKTKFVSSGHRTLIKARS